MIGIEKCLMSSTMINEVNTMTPRQNDLVVKNSNWKKSSNLYNSDSTYDIHGILAVLQKEKK